METKHHIFCGGVSPQNTGADTTKLVLNLWQNRPETNVRLTIEHLHEKLYKTIPAQFHDLLEIAAYVYCGDHALKRGALDVQTLGANWRRRMHFHIPVRRLSLWNDPKINTVLRQTLDYLSDDYYDFSFYSAKDAPLLQDYFTGFDTGTLPKQKPEQVMMFSGGLDSLAGAIEEIVVKKRMVTLVNHQSTPKFKKLYETLGKGLMDKCGDMKPLHLRVEINKAQSLNKEYTQRARSFLYASLGATVAMMLDVRKLCFYENGIVSLNLPVCAQVIGGRATRTTHPRVLAELQELFSLLAGEKFTVDNPFLWNTKGEVVKKIMAANCGPLIASSRSCAHTWETTNEHTHCGVCSQCIDRRFGVVAAEAEEFDPLRQYAVDVFTQSAPKDADKIMGAAYLEKAIQFETAKEVPQFIADNPEVRRMLRYVEGTPTGVAGRVMELHQHHAKEVTGALKTLLGRNLDGVIKATLPPDCLLRISYETGSPTTMPAVTENGNALPTTSAEAKTNPDLPMPRYLLRRGAGLWKVIYDGKEGEIDLGRGISLVAYLLFNPPPGGLHGTELANRVFGQEILQEASLGADGDSTRRKIEKEAIKWNAVMKDPGASESEKAEALEELQNLADSLNVTRMDSEGGADKQVRAIRRAIDRLIEKLRDAKDRKNNPHMALRAFGEHLHKHLWIPSSRFSGTSRSRARAGVAGQFTYERPADVVWVE